MKAYDPASDDYVPLAEPSRRDYWSFFEAADRDRRQGRIRSAESIAWIAQADDAAGRASAATSCRSCSTRST